MLSVLREHSPSARCRFLRHPPGPLHFVAHQLFKPFLLAGGAFWLAVFLRGFLPATSTASIHANRWRWPLIGILTLLYAAVYVPSATINVLDQAWTLRDTSENLHGFPGVLHLFNTPQSDGFYRPLTLLSLWFDYRLFGSALWAYHLPNLLLHGLNSFLVYLLVREFRFTSEAALWSAALFLLAAANFEPILWPAARFDLFATAFVLVSVIRFLRYLREPGSAFTNLLVAAAAYVLAVFNKETGYCVPLLLAAIVLTRKTWMVDRIPRLKLLRAGFTFAGLTSLMLSVRVAIYNGLGGYPPAIHGGSSPHFSLTVKSITGLLTRVIPIPLFGINTSVPLTPAMKGFVLLYLSAITWAVIKGTFVAKPQRILIGLGLLSALPALNLTGWVGESMQHSRYLYLSGLWIVIAAATLIARRPHGTIVLSMLLAANTAGALHNLNVYRTMLAQARSISRQIADDCLRYHITVVDLASIEREPFGVFFFRSEIAESLRAARPDICISLAAGSCQAEQPALRYEWLPGQAAVRAHYLH